MTKFAYQIPDGARMRRTLRIPESHTLHVCPSSCGRRQGIRALRNGIANEVSFLRLSLADVVSGDYLALVEDAVDELAATLDPRPRVMSLFVNCIDDFLGTDERSLVASLSARHPDIRFTLSHIAPIAAKDGKPTARSSHVRLYELIDPPDAKDAATAFVGAFEPLPSSCEIMRVLDAFGAGEARDLTMCETYDDYQALGRARLIVSLSHLGDVPADDLGRRVGSPTVRWHACYDVDGISALYEELAQSLGKTLPDLSEDAQAARKALARARETVGDMPVVVDSAASFMPYSLALALVAAGFRVRAVFGLHVKGCDNDARDRIAKDHPNVMLVGDQSVEAIRGFNLPSDCLSVGRDAAFLLRATHMVDMYHDEGYFGYDGVRKLAEGMIAAMESTETWEV